MKRPDLRVIEVPPHAIAYDSAATVAMKRIVVMVRSGLSPAARAEAVRTGLKIAEGLLQGNGGAR